MRIVDSNGIIINSQNLIHDDIFNQLLFDYSTNTIQLKLIKSTDENYEYTIEFINVVGFEMTSCDFWGESPHVLDFEYIEHGQRYLIPKLYQYAENNNWLDLCKLTTSQNYIETVITFTSGDRLIMACELIEFNKDTGDGTQGTVSVKTKKKGRKK